MIESGWRRGSAVNVLMEELDEAAAFCEEEGCGAEITAFAWPAVLDSPELEDVVRRHREALGGIPDLTLHGPFLDLYVTSPDPRVVEVCRMRHEAGLGAAAATGARVYVAHLNSVPLIRNEAYRRTFVERAGEFWGPLAERAWEDGVTIALENMWEETPDLQRRVVDEVGHPGLRASFDNGHALVFSGLPAPAWIEGLGPVLAHCHLHDNDGTYDAHLPVGEGSEDWPSLLGALQALDEAPVVVLESDDLERNRRSLAAWRGIAGA